MNEVLALALSEYGIKEVSGNLDNPEIMKYYREIGHSWVEHDETAWCSAFVNWCLIKSRYEFTAKLNARSLLEIGIPVAEFDLIDVYVAIFWRDSITSPFGHVGFPIAKRNNLIYTLSGNQSNMVNISGYPENQLLGYRKLKKIL